MVKMYDVNNSDLKGTGIASLSNGAFVRVCDVFNASGCCLGMRGRQVATVPSRRGCCLGMRGRPVGTDPPCSECCLGMKGRQVATFPSRRGCCLAMRGRRGPMPERMSPRYIHHISLNVCIKLQHISRI